MFLALELSINRERKVRQLFRSDPSVGLIIAAVYFEWVVCRAVLFLSSTPNTKLRQKMCDYYSLRKYKELWQQEVSSARSAPTLATIVENWQRVRDAFEARNRLVHGRDRFTRKLAEPHFEALLTGAAYITSYCEKEGFPLHNRLPVRRERSKN